MVKEEMEMEMEIKAWEKNDTVAQRLKTRTELARRSSKIQTTTSDG